MSLGFWTQNSCSPSWVTFLKHAWSGDPPNLLETEPSVRRLVPIPGIQILKADDSHLLDLPNFWANWFSISKACRCTIPLAHIRKKVQGGPYGSWEVFVAVRPSGEIVGTIVRRWCKNVWMHGVKWGLVGVVDYFCIHPGWRKRGVGRNLLAYLHNQTRAPIPPHLMFWEGIQPSLPPLSTGFFWAFQKTGAGLGGVAVGPEERQKAWEMIPKGLLYSEAPDSEIWIGKTRSGFVAIWDTFHRSVPEGKRIGIVIGATSEQDLETIETPFGVLLADHRISSAWTLDSPYQWYAYNMKYGSIQFSFPQLGF